MTGSAQSARLTSQLASPAARGPHVSDTGVPRGQPRGRHLSATTAPRRRWPPATGRAAGDDRAFAVVHGRGQGAARSKAGDEPRRFHLVAATGTAGITAGDEPRRRRVRAVVELALLCAVRPVPACVRSGGARGVRRTREACQTHAQATAATTTAAARHGVNGGGSHGVQKRERGVGGGSPAHRERVVEGSGLGEA